jgi:hypothetical protein
MGLAFAKRKKWGNEIRLGERGRLGGVRGEGHKNITPSILLHPTHKSLIVAKDVGVLLKIIGKGLNRLRRGILIT